MTFQEDLINTFGSQGALAAKLGAARGSIANAFNKGYFSRDLAVMMENLTSVPRQYWMWPDLIYKSGN